MPFPACRRFGIHLCAPETEDTMITACIFLRFWRLAEIIGSIKLLKQEIQKEGYAFQIETFRRIL